MVGGAEMKNKRLYNIWKKMRARCRGDKPCYAHVTVCDEWDDYKLFESWALGNGYADDLSIDRIDNNLGYQPGNCRWVSLRDQARNRRVNKIDERIAGEVLWLREAGLTHKQIGDIYGIAYKTIAQVGIKNWQDAAPTEPNPDALCASAKYPYCTRLIRDVFRHNYVATP